ncbi:nucleotidyltransferase domain-containing protein [Streptomyces sp. NPDC050145]|uniref:nucleotidyltransferase domain-containing protein n=1 Tax=Streptomyces sp. NPDC050145 TaxID=3365602 RepID=UPI0037AF3322
MDDLVKALTEQARRLVADRFPQARGAVLGGSAARGTARGTSDLDVAVLLPDGAPARREVIRHEGRLAELFLHAGPDLERFFEEDRAVRRGTVLFLYDEGVVLADPHGEVARMRERAGQVLAAGPLPLTEAQRERSRYVLTCWLDDLYDTPREARSEQLAVADAALRETAHLLTAWHNAWTGIGRWLPRRLLTADPERGGALLAGHRAVAETGDPGPLAEAARAVLELVGGELREGYVEGRR